MSWVPSSYGKKNKREKKKGKKRVEEISQDERKKIRERKHAQWTAKRATAQCKGCCCFDIVLCSV